MSKCKKGEFEYTSTSSEDENDWSSVQREPSKRKISEPPSLGACEVDGESATSDIEIYSDDSTDLYKPSPKRMKKNQRK